jgi:hypothetical protein
MNQHGLSQGVGGAATAQADEACARAGSTKSAIVFADGRAHLC